jgi:hypothetical protein
MMHYSSEIYDLLGPAATFLSTPDTTTRGTP